MAKGLTAGQRAQIDQCKGLIDKMMDKVPKASMGLGGGLLLSTIPVVGTVLAIGAVATGVTLELKDKIKGK